MAWPLFTPLTDNRRQTGNYLSIQVGCSVKCGMCKIRSNLLRFLSSARCRQCRRCLSHWRREIKLAFAAASVLVLSLTLDEVHARSALAIIFLALCICICIFGTRLSTQTEVFCNAEVRWGASCLLLPLWSVQNLFALKFWVTRNETTHAAINFRTYAIVWQHDESEQRLKSTRRMCYKNLCWIASWSRPAFVSLWLNAPDLDFSWSPDLPLGNDGLARNTHISHTHGLLICALFTNGGVIIEG